MRLFTDQFEIVPAARPQRKAIGWFAVMVWFAAVFGLTLALLPVL